ncbi:MAG: DMT family transporter, partial [Acidobacteriia bacterium]|nr:DMT family transporter [Terriglobia bacterium]
MQTAAKSRTQLLAAALLFSTGGAAIKATTLTNWQVAGFRSFIAAVVLLVLLPEARRNWTVKTGFISIAYAGTLVLFVSATKLTTAANAIYLQSTSPLYLVLLGPWLLKEKTRRRDWWTLAVIGCGMALFFAGAEAPRATAPDPMRGNLMAAGSGLCWALTLAGFRWLAGKGAGSLATVAGGNCLAALFCLPMA